MSAPAISLCSMVNSPPGRVAATVQALQALDPEVVLAVDERVDPRWVDGYRQIADRIFVVAFPGGIEPMFGWLCEQCSGRWILHLDADEVPAPRPRLRDRGDDRGR